MIYLKQRALAEEEARERAEEMRRKAEEVFDLNMEVDDSAVGIHEPSTVPDIPTLPPSSPETGAETVTGTEIGPGIGTTNEEGEDTLSPSSPNKNIQPSMVEGDVLNLFHEDVEPETSSAASKKDVLESLSVEEKTSGQPTSVHQPVVVALPPVSQDRSSAITETVVQDRPRTPQKLSLELYHARRLASTISEERDVALSAAVSDPPATEVKDVEMTEATPITTSRETEEATACVDDLHESKVEPALTVPKVKLSLQEYQKQRHSQRNTVETGPLKSVKTVDPKPDTPKPVDSGITTEAANEQDTEPIDVEMTGGLQETTAGAGVEEQAAARDDYFQVGPSLPTPLIGLSSRAQAGDYFPVQPFSPLSLSAGPTPFSKLNLTSSPPRPSATTESQSQAQASPIVGTQSPGRSSVGQRIMVTSSPKEPQGNSSSDLKSPGIRLGSSPPPALASSGWRTPRSQRGHSPAPGPSAAGGGFRGSSLSISDHRTMDARSAEARIASPRYYGSPSDRPERSAAGPLTSPPRERQHSITTGAMPGSPFDAGYSSTPNHYGYEDSSSSSSPLPFKRAGHLVSPTGPLPASSGPREYYKADERSRHRSMNGDEWGYGNMDPTGYGGYRGPRGAPPPPPRDRDRDRDRVRERDHERERRDRFERRGDYFGPGLPGGGGIINASGNNGNGLYGPSRGSGGPAGPGGMGGYGRRSSDYYGGGQLREEGYGSNKKDGPSDNPSVPY
ncbi:hypothetical protein BGZ65_007652 [Modicella reniformis]|uniref:Uncharacterized protein n=1 Tax=Modicella reniformis TaxID=1440133 RepID=A0A9P6IVA0_9FUNG|nr:hypothetical protein BGZ65_007652 [Modicella reniformis]